MDRIDTLRLFVSVAELGSFTRAADREGITPGAASKQITALETRLQARLLERTTRSVRLTDAGEALLERIRPWLAEFEVIEEGFAEENAAPAGTLRVSAPVDFGGNILMPVIADFMRQWPGLDVRLSLADRMVDLVDEGYDLAVRIGHLADSSLIAKRLAPACMSVVASPDYLAAAGRPETPGNLTQHDCIIDRNKPAPQLWKFERDGQTEEVKVTGRVTLNGAIAAVEAAAQGLGITCGPAWAAREALAAKRVVPVLPDWSPDHRDLWAVFPSNRYLAHRVRLFVDHLAAHFKDGI
ncbi:LysR family transcriptional regulator [Hyphobacterium sp.]|uniref:LysR family transcriptional regulator n=1 Tax=Hyphobacterium sp. TaxID=2004662 RepID=UPI003BACE418